MFRPMRDVARDPQGKVLLLSTFLLLAMGTIVDTLLEGWSPLDPRSIPLVTLATVGFGGCTPTTDLAKLFTIGSVITGIGILATFVSEIARHLGAAANLLSRRAAAVGSAVAREAEETEEHVEPDTRP